MWGMGGGAIWEGIKFLVTLGVNPRSTLGPAAGLDQDQQVRVGKQHTHQDRVTVGPSNPKLSMKRFIAKLEGKQNQLLLNHKTAKDFFPPGG